MVFTGLMIFLNRELSTTILDKIALKHPHCYKIRMASKECIIAHYLSPLDIARIFEHSKSFFYTVCFSGQKYRNYSRKTLTISKNSQMSFGIIEKNKGQIIFNKGEIVIVRFRSFLKSCKVLQKLKLIKVKVNFTKLRIIRDMGF